MHSRSLNVLHIPIKSLSFLNAVELHFVIIVAKCCDHNFMNIDLLIQHFRCKVNS